MPHGTSLIYEENLEMSLKRIHVEIKKPDYEQNPPKPTIRAFNIEKMICILELSIIKKKMFNIHFV